MEPNKRPYKQKQKDIFIFLKTLPQVELPTKAIPWVSVRFKVSASTMRLLLFQYRKGIFHSEN